MKSLLFQYLYNIMIVPARHVNDAFSLFHVEIEPTFDE